MRKILYLFLAILFVFGIFLMFQKKPNTGLYKIKVGDKKINVNLANTDYLRAKGLGDVKNLPENQGMLFNFDQKNIMPRFWMKDMFIPLDMIWITGNKIIQIDKNIPYPDPGTPDSSLKLYAPSQGIDYVLEVNAGFSDKNNIKVGDNIDLTSLK